MIRRSSAWAGAAALALLVLAAAAGRSAAGEAEREEPEPRRGEALYRSSCASCHGEGGAGAPELRGSFPVPLPDFTDCEFAPREPDSDWVAVTHEGGPARGFSPLMPPFGETLTVAEIERILEHVRTFCADPAWPRGELNLPRPLVTTKAFPEDEAVLESAVAVEGQDVAMQELVYEWRVGPRGQLEIAVPFGYREQADGGDRVGFGDVRLGGKHAFFHDFELGSIVSAAVELRLPTGDDAEGFGLGTAALEPYLAWGQLLPYDFFLQGQAGFELPFDEDKAEDEAFWRLVLGRSFVPEPFGRTWSPMVEILGWKPLTAAGDVEWDVVPQMQVTLNRRQHVRLGAGVRIPLTNAGRRDTQALLYLLWDWYDGGFFEGW